MMTQSDLFTTADDIAGEVVTESGAVVADARATQIAIPCGFRNRHNSPCQRLGNWPVMIDGKQMICRDRPMVHCDPDRFKDDAPAQQYGNDDIDWNDRIGMYDDEQ